MVTRNNDKQYKLEQSKAVRRILWSSNGVASLPPKLLISAKLQNDQWAVEQIPLAFYDTHSGDTVRLGISYRDSYRIVFWCEVKQDGSIYLGPRHTNISSLLLGSKKAKDGVLAISYDEGQEVDPSMRDPKISFHASGIIHTAGECLYRGSLRELQAQEELCRLLFRHPSHFESIGQARKRDILLNYPVSEEACLEALLFIAPINKTKLVRIRNCHYQTNLFLSYSALDCVPDLSLQLVLFHGTNNPWPPRTYIIFGTKTVQND